MANIFFNLPTAAGNGIGAPVDVSTCGALKSIVCAGNADVTINVEINNAAVNTDGSWQSIATFQGTGSTVINVAARWVRVRSSAYNTNKGGTTQVDMGSTDSGTLFAALSVPTGTGVGAAVDVSALPAFKTIQVGGAFRGTLLVEVSEDGITEWGQPFSFQSPGAQSSSITAKWMRVRRVGVPEINPGAPVVNVGGSLGVGGAGGGIAVSAGSQSVGTGTVLFANSNGISFGMSGSSQITASYSQSTSPAAISAGTQLASSGTVVFSNSNSVSFGMSAGTITAAVAGSTAPGAIAAGTQTATSGTVVFANSNSISFGMSGSSQITASYVQSLSAMTFNDFVAQVNVSNARLSLNKVSVAGSLSATLGMMCVSMSQVGGTLSSGAVNLSVGMYTLSGSTASLVSSASRQFSWTSGSDTNDTNQYAGASGIRYRSIPVSFAITPGEYLIAYHIATSNSGNVNVSGRGGGGATLNYDGTFYSSLWMDGFFSSALTSAFPNSVAVTNAQYERLGGNAGRMPGIFLFGTY